VTEGVARPGHRPVWAEIDHGAIRHNVQCIAGIAAPADMMAVVKADAYGHGAPEVARTALAAGAVSLGVAMLEEAVDLREAGVTAPVLLLSEPPVPEAPAMVAAGVTAVVYSDAMIEALEQAAGAVDARVPVHLKIDTGMHRVGCAPEHALAAARSVAVRPHLELAGVMTHLAVADEPDDPYTDDQLDRFDVVLSELRAAGVEPGVVHAANTAGALAHPRARHDLVRVGIGVYGLPPSAATADIADLRPAMSLHARVSHVQRVEAGTRVSYGLRWRADRPTTLATVPVGYADGVPRRLGATGGEVLVGGRRRPIAGTVTMDQILVDLGDDPVAPGDHVVLIGEQGRERITAVEWADRLDTIGYEIVCGIGARVPRRHVGCAR
jgi:alanine racemase